MRLLVLLKYEEQRSLKGEMLRLRSWYSVLDLVQVSLNTWSGFLLAEMCAVSDLSALCALGYKLLHRLIHDIWRCPDPVKMGAVSPRKLRKYALPSWAGFTAQPVNPRLQLHSSAELWAAARAQCALGWCRRFTSLFLWLRFCSCDLWSGVVLVKGSAEYGDRPLGEVNVYDTT